MNNSTEKVRKDFLDALERLLTGHPRHPDIKRSLERGTLKVSISTVAKEAGRSRTLIGQSGTKYNDIREAIIGASSVDENSNQRRINKQHLSDHRNGEIKRLRDRIQLLASENAALEERIKAFEKQSISRQQFTTETVTPFRRGSE